MSEVVVRACNRITGPRAQAIVNLSNRVPVGIYGGEYHDFADVSEGDLEILSDFLGEANLEVLELPAEDPNEVDPVNPVPEQSLASSAQKKREPKPQKKPRARSRKPNMGVQGESSRSAQDADA